MPTLYGRCRQRAISPTLMDGMGKSEWAKYTITVRVSIPYVHSLRARVNTLEWLNGGGSEV